MSFMDSKSDARSAMSVLGGGVPACVPTSDPTGTKRSTSIPNDIIDGSSRPPTSTRMQTYVPRSFGR